MYFLKLLLSPSSSPSYLYIEKVDDQYITFLCLVGRARRNFEDKIRLPTTIES
jgi:hypothetical protein